MSVLLVVAFVYAYIYLSTLSAVDTHFSKNDGAYSQMSACLRSVMTEKIFWMRCFGVRESMTGVHMFMYVHRERESERERKIDREGKRKERERKRDRETEEKRGGIYTYV